MDEIQQADIFKEEITAITKTEKLVSLTSSTPSATSSLTREPSAVTPTPTDSVNTEVL